MSRPNRGVAATLTDLLSATDSEIVARMDADDLVLPGRFWRQQRAIEAGADAVFTTVVAWGSGLPGLPRPTAIRPAEFGLHLLLTNPVAHSTLVARRSSILDAGGYRSLPTEDYDLWLRMAARGARMHRLALPGIAYRVHSGQVTASVDWRRASWESPELAASYSTLAEQLIHHASAARITSLSIAEGLSDDEKRAQMDAFATHFESAVATQRPRAQRALRRKLAERRAWLNHRLTHDQAART